MKTIPQELNYSLFETLTGASFQLEDIQGNSESLLLSELTSHASHFSASKDPGKFPFSMIFHLKSSKVSIPQGIYTLSNPSIGQHLLFFVPIQPDEKGKRLEVHVN